MHKFFTELRQEEPTGNGKKNTTLEWAHAEDENVMSSTGFPGFTPGTLWETVQTRTAQAMQCLAIHPIRTRSELIEEDGVTFLLRVVSALARKDHADNEQPQNSSGTHKQDNPFLPYDQNLFVADISDTHVCVLNKYQVLDYHILLVTRSFQEQESPLTVKDFEAVLACLAEFNGLAFYNAGETAGASQRHKHLQMVPLPLGPGIPPIPIEPLWRTARFEGAMGIVPGLRFRHALARMDSRWSASALEGARELVRLYGKMAGKIGLASGGEGGDTVNPGPYNLLITREWIFLVPRSTECFEGISINALGFAGALLVKDEAQRQLVKIRGPMTALHRVALGSSPA